MLALASVVFRVISHLRLNILDCQFNLHQRSNSLNQTVSSMKLIHSGFMETLKDIQVGLAWDLSISSTTASLWLFCKYKRSWKLIKFTLWRFVQREPELNSVRMVSLHFLQLLPQENIFFSLRGAGKAQQYRDAHQQLDTGKNLRDRTDLVGKYERALCFVCGVGCDSAD